MPYFRPVQPGSEPLSSNTPGLMPRHSASLSLKRELPYGFYAAAGAQYVTLALDNRFDRRYFISAHDNADMFHMPGEPRALTVSVKWRMQRAAIRSY